MAARNQILQIYTSRHTILNILESVYNYDIKDYSGFSINEIDAMITNNQLDMLLTSKKSEGGSTPTRKTYISYIINNALNSKTISNIVEDLFILSNTLTTDDCLCIIYEGEPNDSILNHLTTVYAQSKYYIVVHNLKRLQFNILEHFLTPEVTILNDRERDEMKKRYNVENNSQLPEISRFDPLALAICLRPGQVCRFMRNSPTAMNSPYYRICV
jgi:DNA-directed RNA polymerase subunit H (RpoH/RPB5)